MGWWHDVETWKWDESGGEEMHHTFDVMNVVLLGWKSDVFHTLINILIRNESRSIWKMQRLCICITQPHYRSTPSSQTPSFLRPSEDFPFVGACLQESQSDFCWLPCDGGQIPMCSRVGCFWLCWLQKRCTKPLMFRMQVWPWEANQRCWFTPLTMPWLFTIVFCHCMQWQSAPQRVGSWGLMKTKHDHTMWQMWFVLPLDPHAPPKPEKILAGQLRDLVCAQSPTVVMQKSILLLNSICSPPSGTGSARSPDKRNPCAKPYSISNCLTSPLCV